MVWMGNTLAAVAMGQMEIACERFVVVVVQRFVNKLGLQSDMDLYQQKDKRFVEG